MLSYSGHEAGGVLVLTVEEMEPGEEGMARREWLYKTIGGRGEPRVGLGLGSVRDMPRSGRGVLITLKRRIDARKGKVVLVNVDPFIYDILRTMRIDKLFAIAPDLNAALKLLSA